MTKTSPTKLSGLAITSEPTTKSQQVIDLLSREGGATLEEISTLANWLPHSTRSFMTGLTKRGHVIESDKVDNVLRFQIASNGDA